MYVCVCVCMCVYGVLCVCMCTCVCVCVCVCVSTCVRVLVNCIWILSSINDYLWRGIHLCGIIHYYYSAGKQRYGSRVEVMRVEIN